MCVHVREGEPAVDLSDWKAAAECARCDKLEHLLGHVPMGVLVVDREGRFVYLNEATLRLVGSPSVETTQAFNAFSLPTFKESGLDEALRRCLAGEELAFDVDYTSMWGKTTPMRIVMLPLREGDAVGAAAVYVASRAEVGLLTAENAQLRSASESADMELRALDGLRDRFIATVSHELRTPLVPLLGYLRLLRQGRLGELQPDQAKAVRVSADNAERLLELVEKVLAVTGEGRDLLAREMEPIDVADLLLEAQETMDPLAEKHGLSIEVQRPRRLPAVLGNRSKLVQVLLALLDNARKHTPSGGRVVLSAETAGDELVALEVADTGEAVPPEERERIFEPFHQVGPVSTRRHGGIGLGLTIVREIVTAHGGTIALVDRAGFGAAFRVELPVASERPAHRELSSVELLHTRVLLVETNEPRQELLATLLTAHRYLVRTAPSTDAARDLLGRWTPGAILLGMEGEGALGLLTSIRRGEKDHLVPVFGICAAGDHESKRAALDAGATAVLLEPLDEAWLLRLLGAVYPTFL